MPACASGLTPMCGVLYFYATDGVHGHELWRSDGTAQGTWLVEDLRTGETGSFDSLSYLLAACPRLYFNANDGVVGNELWMLEISLPYSYFLPIIFRSS